jgi:hypothetical protein
MGSHIAQQASYSRPSHGSIQPHARRTKQMDASYLDAVCCEEQDKSRENTPARIRYPAPPVGEYPRADATLVPAAWRDDCRGVWPVCPPLHGSAAAEVSHPPPLRSVSAVTQATAWQLAKLIRKRQVTAKRTLIFMRSSPYLGPFNPDQSNTSFHPLSDSTDKTTMPLFDMNRALTHIVFGVYGPLPPIYQVTLDPKPRGV